MNNTNQLTEIIISKEHLDIVRYSGSIFSCRSESYTDNGSTQGFTRIYRHIGIRKADSDVIIENVLVPNTLEPYLNSPNSSELIILKSTVMEGVDSVLIGVGCADSAAVKVSLRPCENMFTAITSKLKNAHKDHKSILNWIYGACILVTLLTFGMGLIFTLPSAIWIRSKFKRNLIKIETALDSIKQIPSNTRIIEAIGRERPTVEVG